ncbi:MAG TPA: hypothetical protein VGY76_02480 [Solirubrobacteraceae bacterium]|jgi:hypothetical protein|nr:hypothetical protein [Solirubrobacteraceae bacterium]
MRFSVLRATQLVGALLLLAIATPAVADAEFGAPGWELTTHTYPTNLTPGGKGTIAIDVFNIGAGDSHGAITVTDKLPAGVTASSAGELLSWRTPSEPRIANEVWICTGNGPGAAPRVEGASEVSCTNNPETFPSFAGGAGQPTQGGAAEFQSPANPQPIVGIAVNAPEAQSTQSNRVTVSGGGAASAASVEDPVTVSASPPPFGPTVWDGWFSNADGTLDLQAGSHPYSWTTSFDLAQKVNEEGAIQIVGGEPRDLIVKLPQGLVGNPTAVPQCTRQELDNETDCPLASQVGELTANLEGLGGTELKFSVYNMVPPPGVPAELGADIVGISTFVDASLRTGDDYGITAHVDNIPEREIAGAILTLWGVPGDPSHDRWRNPHFGGCSFEQIHAESEGCSSLGNPRVVKPFLTLPSSCAGPQPFSISANRWTEPAFTEPVSFLMHEGEDAQSGFARCAKLPFTPAVAATPETGAADSPTGLHVDVHVPQPEIFYREDRVGVQTGLAEANLKNITVSLPAGVSLNPSSAGGLVGCSTAQVELNGPQPAQCPAASKIGSVEVDTPLLDHPVKGGMYVAAPHDNPFNSLLAIYVAVDDPKTGVVIKSAGDVEADPSTGQLTAHFTELPEQPFEDLKVDLFGGPGAVLRTPSTCGTYTTNSDLTPWTTPEEEDKLLSSSFQITGGPGGSACANSEAQEPHAPAFEAGTVAPVAGAYSPFVLRLSREDGSQYLKSLNTTLPPGLIGKLAGIAQCSQAGAQAAEHKTGGEEQQSPSCPAASEVGTVDVAAGAGPHPYHVTGHVYLMGPYNGAPFSFAVITPAVAGPYDLGTVVVRAGLYIDPHTTQVRAVSDAFPSILQGIPLDVRSIALNVSRPEFILNPTNCSQMAVTGEAVSTLGQVAPLSSHFDVGGCQGLVFKPSFKVSTQAKTSKKAGASLDVKVGYPQGSEANLRSVAVTLPKQLPARLTTIQQACPQATFAANPASCPAGSNIGTATAHTPLLASPLAGPAYLVSHGGASFPDVVVILQGEGVTFDLVGSIDIKKGVTSSTFASIPDAPISSFELNLPEGPHSGLAAVLPAKAKGSLCGSSLTMPTTLTGQNGAQIKQSTKITVTGCPKAKKKSKPAKHKKTKAKKGSLGKRP